MRSLAILLRDEEGQDLIEYALLASFIAMISIVALRALGTKVAAFYTEVGSKF